MGEFPDKFDEDGFCCFYVLFYESSSLRSQIEREVASIYSPNSENCLLFFCCFFSLWGSFTTLS